MERDRRDRAALLRENCGVWPRYKNASLDDLELPKRKLTPEEFTAYVDARDKLGELRQSPGILVLAGGNGPGKSHLVSALINAVCGDLKRARFVTANDFFLELKSTFGSEGRTQMDLIKKFRTYHLLGIDEIEVRSDSAWENNQLRDLVNARYSMMVSTVICTNKTPEQLLGTDGAAYLGTALRDRIRESGGIVHFWWKSLRGE
jgi:DNA replication protein DnaC